ncbi:unnamed protein product [Protopolystoma xenopodis]|uniref:LIM zinc-binding domain-containing protein n=1 Tax=Protopolystoma xenopodis TaxID=117903 RepID=A0A3S5CJG5_9PLAT|nr:unnamed protein product [Protopolystoma xenopodis]
MSSDEIVRVVALDKEFHVDCYRCEDCRVLLADEPERRCYPLLETCSSPSQLSRLTPPTTIQHLLCLSCHLSRIGAVPATLPCSGDPTTTGPTNSLAGGNGARLGRHFSFTSSPKLSPYSTLGGLGCSDSSNSLFSHHVSTAAAVAPATGPGSPATGTHMTPTERKVSITSLPSPFAIPTTASVSATSSPSSTLSDQHHKPILLYLGPYSRYPLGSDSAPNASIVDGSSQIAPAPSYSIFGFHGTGQDQQYSSKYSSMDRRGMGPKCFVPTPWYNS